MPPYSSPITCHIILNRYYESIYFVAGSNEFTMPRTAREGILHDNQSRIRTIGKHRNPMTGQYKKMPLKNEKESAI